MSQAKGNTHADATVRRGESEHRFRAREEHMPDSPTDLGRPSWKAVLKRTVAEFGDDGGTDLAAALTFYAVLSLFPAIIALTSVLGVLGQGRATSEAALEVVRNVGVADTQLETVETFLDSMQSNQAAGWGLALGLLGALWAASNYVNAFSRAMNRIYEVVEGRPFWKLRPAMLALTVVLLLLVMVVGLSLVFTGGIAEAVGSVIGLGDTAVLAWQIAKWPVLLLVVIGIVALLYWGTPNIKQPKFRWVSPGAGVAIVVAVVATAGFGFYVANFGNYDATYGALAGVIVLLLWLWLMNVALVFGAEFDAELERGRELYAGLPAEEVIQLPPRDTRNSDKKARKHAEMLETSRRIRLRAGRRDG